MSKPYPSIRLSDGHFADQVMGKYGWLFGSPRGRASLIYLQPWMGERGNMTSAVHLDLHIRHIRPVIQMMARFGTTFAPGRTDRYKSILPFLVGSTAAQPELPDQNFHHQWRELTTNRFFQRVERNWQMRRDNEKLSERQREWQRSHFSTMVKERLTADDQFQFLLNVFKLSQSDRFNSYSDLSHFRLFNQWVRASERQAENRIDNTRLEQLSFFDSNLTHTSLIDSRFWDSSFSSSSSYLFSPVHNMRNVFFNMLTRRRSIQLAMNFIRNTMDPIKYLHRNQMTQTFKKTQKTQMNHMTQKSQMMTMLTSDVSNLVSNLISNYFSNYATSILNRKLSRSIANSISVSHQPTSSSTRSSINQNTNQNLANTIIQSRVENTNLSNPSNQIMQQSNQPIYSWIVNRRSLRQFNQRMENASRVANFNANSVQIMNMNTDTDTSTNREIVPIILSNNWNRSSRTEINFQRIQPTVMQSRMSNKTTLASTLNELNNLQQPTPREYQSVRMDVVTKREVEHASHAQAQSLKTLELAVKSVTDDLHQAKERWSQPTPNPQQVADQLFKDFTRRIRFEQQKRGN